MKGEDIGLAKDQLLKDAVIAMQRAALMARKNAIQTDTALVVRRGDQMVLVSAEELRKQEGHFSDQ
ncbi:MAG TPA: hypothetical protein PKE57_00160 [Cellvibrionaceae bacterium]|nr:hypothetical protein [Cellvibrionaceae bacterium]HMW49201.1 hypothetical protein [Cellvibrionaceae bacterium]HMY37726.1 hypothetical protein [Marinagarivorans sp.]HNG60284.1 hypothetical protein [Cellvibrionaceae bacterium]